MKRKFSAVLICVIMIFNEIVILPNCVFAEDESAEIYATEIVEDSMENGTEAGQEDDIQAEEIKEDEIDDSEKSFSSNDYIEFVPPLPETNERNYLDDINNEENSENDGGVEEQPSIEMFTVEQSVKITGFATTVSDSSLWNAPVQMCGTVDNGQGQELTYEYLVYDGYYWRSLYKSTKLQNVEFVPDKITDYLLCFQIIESSGKVLEQTFLSYRPQNDYLTIDNIEFKIDEDGVYYLNADVNTNDNQVKYRWLYYDLISEKWGDIQGWSSEQTATWKPSNGAYWIYVEGQTQNGTISSYAIGEEVKDFSIDINAIEVQLNDDLKYSLEATIITNDDLAEYRWLYYDVEYGCWGVIQDWSSKSHAEWLPNRNTYYWVHVEGRTRRGTEAQYTIGYTVNIDRLIIKDIQIVENTATDIALEANIIACDDKTEYRWLYYDPSIGCWGLIRDWETDVKTIWHPNKSGYYWIHIEGRTKAGEIKQYTVGYTVSATQIEINGIQVEKNNSDRKLSADIITNDKTVQYRWLYYDISTGAWGVIQDWSDEYNAVWTPMKPGGYWLHIEAKTELGKTAQCTIGYVVDPFQIELGDIGVETINDQQYNLSVAVNTDDPNIE